MDMTEEERAALSGHKPLEEFKGNPDHWTDAKTWNENTDKLMPIMKATNTKLEGDLKSTKAEVVALKTTLDKLVKTSATISQREHDRAMATITTQQKDAITESDGDKWQELEKQKDMLEKSKPEPVTVAPVNLEADLAAFKDRNSEWYGKDKAMTGYAMYIADEFYSQGIEPGPEQLQKIEDAVKVAFPEKFGNPRRKEESVDRGNNNPPPKVKKFTYDSLPAEAKAACDSSVESCIRANANLKKDSETKKWVEIYYEDEMAGV